MRINDFRTILAQVRQRPVHGLQVEGRRIEAATGPGQKIYVRRVLRVSVIAARKSS
jgi:hypothetical protein